MRFQPFKACLFTSLLAGALCTTAWAEMKLVDIGRHPAGTITDNGGGSFTLVGGGFDIWDAGDEFAFAYEEVTGDFDLKANVVNFVGNNCCSKAGLMVRETLAEDSRNLNVSIQRGPNFERNDTRVVYRTRAASPGRNGGQNEPKSPDGSYTANPWMRIERVGNTINAYYGPDGVTWNLITSQDVGTWGTGNLNPTLLVGMCAASTDWNRTTTVNYSGYELTRGSAAPFGMIAASSRGKPDGIRLEFNHPIDLASGEPLEPTSYNLNPPDATITAVAAGPNPATIQLTLDGPLTEGVAYTIGVDEFMIFDTVGNNPTIYQEATFTHGEGYEVRRIHLAHNYQWTHGGDLNLYVGSSAYKFGIPEGSPSYPATGSNTLLEDTTPDTGDAINNDFGVRIVGLLEIPADGTYRFASASDDGNYLYLSTDASPANKTVIATEPSWGGTRDYTGNPSRLSAPFTLSAGNRHYLELASAEGGGGNNASATWQKPGDPDIVNGQSPIEETYFVPSRFVAGQLFLNLGPVQVTTPPANVTIVENQVAKMSAVVDGTPPYSFQWRMNGMPIPGATGPSISAPVTLAMNGATIDVVVKNEFSETTSLPATLNVLADTTAPTLVSATPSSALREVTVVFSEPVSAATAGVPGNYVLSGGVNFGSVTILSPTSVRLTLPPSSPPLAGLTLYTLTVNNVADLAGTPNPIAPNSTIDFTTPVYSIPLETTQIGGGALGSIAKNPDLGSFTVVGGGNDIWSGSDEFTFHYVPVSGDFDVRARVESLELVARWSKAGIMVRESLAGNSRMAFSKVTAAGTFTGGSCGSQDGAADVSFMYRTWIAGTAGNGGEHEDRLVGDPGYPAHKWVRLQRLGTVMRGYTSTDGVNWLTPQVQDTAFWMSPLGSSTLAPFNQDALLGFAVARHGCANQATATAQFRDVGVPAATVVTPPANRNVFAGHSVSFTVGVVGYFTAVQWQRNGMDIPGARSLTYTIPQATLADDGATFRAIVANAVTGTFDTSGQASLSVVEDLVAPTLVSAIADTTLRQVRVTFSEGVDPTTAGDSVNYEISGGYSIGTATVESPTTVLLRIADSDANLLDSTTYTLTVNGIQDPALNTIAENSTINFTTPTFSRGYARRDIWKNIGGTQVPELTNNPAYRQPSQLFGYYNLLEGPLDPLDNYGIRISGSLIPSVSGDYNFYSSSDDQSAFWLSTDANPANLAYLCGQPSWNGFRNYADADGGTFNGTTTPVPLMAGAQYPFLSFMKEGGGGDNLSVAWQVPGQPVPADGSLPITGANLATFVDATETALVRFDIWYNIGGGVVSDLTGNPRWPNSPSDTWFGRGSAGSFDSRVVHQFDNKDNYGMKISGWYVPSANGNYQFYVRSDDQAILYLSPNADPAAKQQILVNACCNGAFEAGRRSAPQTLVAGTPYYLELVYKEGGGGNYGAVGVALEGGAVPGAPIGADNLAPFAPYANPPAITITQQPQDVTKFINRVATFSVAAVNSAGVPMTYQWRKNGAVIPGATSPAYSTPPVPATDDGVQYDVIVAVLGRNAYSDPATLTVDQTPRSPILLGTAAGPRNSILLTFDEMMDPVTAGDEVNYTLNEGNVTAADVLPDGFSVVLVTDTLLAGQQYTVTAAGVFDAYGLEIQPGDDTATFFPLATLDNVVLRQTFLNLSGPNILATLTNNAKYPFSPDQTDLVPTTITPQTSPDIGNYGTRMRTYLFPSETGFHTFEHHSDDAGVAYIGLEGDATRYQTLVQQADGTCCGFIASQPVFLVAGRWYYIEMIFQEGGGGDYQELRWKTPSNPAAFVDIPSANLAFAADATQVQITQQPADIETLEKRAVTFSFGVANPQAYPLSYQWYLNGAEIPGATGATYTTPLAELTDDGNKYSAVVSVLGVLIGTTAEATLTVLPDTEAPELVSVQASPALNQFIVRFNEAVDPNTAGDPVNWTIAGLDVQAAVVSADGRTVTLTTSPQMQNTDYTVEFAGVQDLAGNEQSGNASVRSYAFTPGLVKIEFYYDVFGANDINTVNDLLNHPTYPNSPNEVRYNSVASWRPANNDYRSSYGVRISGVFVPPVDGEYRFYTISDDSVRFQLSTDLGAGTLADVVVQPCCNGGYDEGRSGVVMGLVAGQQYYFELLGREVGGGDYWGVAVRVPGDTRPAGSLPDMGGALVGLYADPVPASLEITQQPQDTVFLIDPPTLSGGGGGYQAVLSEDFTTGDGGFTVETPIAYDGPWTYNAGTGSWRQDGQDPENGHPNTSLLNSPPVTITTSGAARLTFMHRYSFEGDFWDGGQVRVSINGGPYVAVPLVAFSAGGYNGSVRANSSSLLSGQPAFVLDSPGYATEMVTSVVNLGDLNAGDTVSVQFIAASDTNTRAQVPNWEITSVVLEQGGLGPLTTFTVQALGLLGGQPTTVYYQWQKNTGGGWMDIAGATGTSLTLAPLLSDNGTLFRVRALIPGEVEYSREALLTVVQLNTAPRFTKGPDQGPLTCPVGPVSVPGWATDIIPHSIPQEVGSFSSAFDSGPLTPMARTFSSDFSTAPAGVGIYGNGGVVNGYLRLTDNVNSQAGSILINSLQGTVVSFQASFKLRIGDASGNGADGFSFNLAGDLPDAATGATVAEDGLGTGLSVIVDNYPTGGTDAPSFKLKWGGAFLGFILAPKWNNPNFIPVTITMTDGGLLTVNVDGTNVVADLATPFTPVTGRFGLFARTGGENETHWVDDLNITANILTGAPAPAGSALYGTAYIADGSVHLTDAVNGQGGSFIVDDLLGGARLGSFELNFSALLGGGTTPPADGFAVSIANNLPAGVFGEEGAGSGLTISFDSYDNTDGDPFNGVGEAPAIDVIWNGVTVASTMVPVEAFDTLGNFAPVSIRLDPDGTLDVVAAGNVIYDNLATGYVPILGAKFGIGARTGGLNTKHWIGDLAITAYPVDASSAEALQTVHFNVSTDNPGLFAVAPAIDANGTLTYTPAAGMVGVAHVTVVAQDDGGTAYGGQDSSAPQMFMITVVDFTPPMIACPPNQVIEFTGSMGAMVPNLPTVSDECDPAPALVCLPPLNRPVPVGTTTVTCTATDKAGNSATCSFTVTVLGPRQVKDRLADDLEMLLATTTRSKDREKLMDAIVSLWQSLDPSLWIGSDRLERKHGDRVFKKEREAVKKLCDLLKDKNSTVPAAEVQAIIDRIFEIDRTLAVIAIEDAIAKGANRKKITEAQKHLAKGDEQVADDKKCDDGINHYEEAWKKAVRAKVEHKLHRGPGGRTYLDVLGEPGMTYNVQVTSDLVTWTTIGTVKADKDGYVLFSDPGAAGQAMRFYRVVEPQP